MQGLIFEWSLSKNWGASLIPLVLRSEYSHVSLVLDIDTLLSARMIGGVQKHTRDTNNYVKQEYWLLECDPTVALKWAHDQIGKGYDFGAAFRFFLFFLNEDKKNFMCSEYSTVAIKHTNIFTSPPKYNSWAVSPVELLRQFKILNKLHNPVAHYLGTELSMSDFE